MNSTTMSADLVGRSVMLEIAGFVSTGIVSHIEGDIIEIDNDNAETYGLGQSAKVVIYAKGGLINFESAIVGKTAGTVIILNPPEIKNSSLQRRQNFRVPVSIQGTVDSIIDGKGIPLVLDQPVPIHVLDIGLGGIAFHIPEYELNPGSVLKAELPIGEQVESYHLLVLHSRTGEGNLRVHGCKFQSISDEQLQTLYAFTLGEQIRARLEIRKRGLVPQGS